MQNLDTSKKPTNFPPAGDFIPPLENGDRLTRDEFHRRYEAVPERVKAELINGVVYVSSPVRVKKHGKPHSHIMGWLFNYYAATDIVELADNVTYQVEGDDEVQPDAVLWIGEDYGGKAFVTDTDYLEGSPELSVEIASSTVSFDLHDKKDIYERNKVQEYVVWRVLDHEIDWFRLENGKYVRLEPNAEGIFESRIFSGLRLNVKAMLENDLQEVIAELQNGINSAEHQKFVESLQKKQNS